MNVSLKQFKIQRPKKVTYEFPLFGGGDLTDHVKSKNLRSFLLKTDEVLQKNEIELGYEDLSQYHFRSERLSVFISLSLIGSRLPVGSSAIISSG